MPFNPAYINITTHRTEVIYREVSSGIFQRTTARMRPGTVAIAAALKGRYGIPTVPHVICSGFSRTELENELIDLSYLGITDLLVLRGDRAKGENRFVAESDGHEHAIDLCHQVSNFNNGKMLDGTEHDALNERFSFGVAGYPEKHEEAMNMEMDIEYLKAKIEAGAEYVVTQMFFDNSRYFSFVERCREAGINVPIIPGIKPLKTARQLSIIPKTFKVDIPQALATEVLKCKTDEEVRQVGVEWCTAQCQELIAHGVPSIHFYAMAATDSVKQVASVIY
jgi:methylenetetrahydrofolate reductase (NADPH)